MPGPIDLFISPEMKIAVISAVKAAVGEASLLPQPRYMAIPLYVRDGWVAFDLLEWKRRWWQRKPKWQPANESNAHLTVDMSINTGAVSITYEGFLH